MENNKKSAGTIALVVLLLIVTIASLVLATYAWAKYTTTNTGNTTAVVAKWNVTGNSTDLTWSQTFNHVVSERLAPGTNGTIPVNFSINDSEVDVDYTVTLVSATNKPANLHFYTDSTKETEIIPGNTAYSGRITTAGVVTMNANNVTSNASLVNGKAITPSIYWDWQYEETKLPDSVSDTALAALRTLAASKDIENASTMSYDDLKTALASASVSNRDIIDTIDTAEGKTPQTMTVAIRIDAVQVNPAAE